MAIKHFQSWFSERKGTQFIEITAPKSSEVVDPA